MRRHVAARYRLHDVGLEIGGDRSLVADLLERMAVLPAGEGVAAELRFVYRRRGRWSKRVLPAHPRGRPVYELPSGEVLYSRDEDRLVIRFREQVEAVCDPSSGSAELYVYGAEEDATHLASHLLFTICLVELMKRRGRFSVHAAGLRVGERALLLGGTSGAGKSTLSLALLRRAATDDGTAFLGDDMLFLEGAGEGVNVLAFPDRVGVTGPTLALFPELADGERATVRARADTAARGAAKHEFRAEDVYGIARTTVARPGLLVFPRVAGEARSVLEPLGPAEAGLILASNVLLTEARSTQAHLDALRALAEASECYRLHTGRDLDDVAGELLSLARGGTTSTRSHAHPAVPTRSHAEQPLATPRPPIDVNGGAGRLAPASARLSDEAELLITCAANSTGAELRDRLARVLSPRLDWVRVLKTVLTRGTLPLLYQGLAQAPPGAVPEQTLRQLRERSETSARRSLRLAEELVDVVELLDRRGIEVIPLKGPTLAVSAYGSVELREFADLDVLVRCADAPAAHALLRAHGYCAATDGVVGRDRARLPVNFVHELVHERRGTAVELHWGVTRWHYSSPIELEGAWDRLRSVPVCGRALPALAPEDELLVVAVHASKHRWERLDWIADVAGLIRRQPEMEWDRLVELALRQGARRMVWLGLSLAEELLAAPVPDAARRWLGGDASVDALRRDVVERLFAGETVRSGADRRRSAKGDGLPFKVGFDLALRERFADRARYCVELAGLALRPAAWRTLR